MLCRRGGDRRYSSYALIDQAQISKIASGRNKIFEDLQLKHRQLQGEGLFLLGRHHNIAEFPSKEIPAIWWIIMTHKTLHGNGTGAPNIYHTMAKIINPFAATSIST